VPAQSRRATLVTTAQGFGYVNLVAFVALGAVAIRQWRSRHDRAAGWAAAAFGSIALVVLAGRAVPQHPHLFVERALARVAIAGLVVFPYLLFRFARTFGRRYRRFDICVGSLTALLLVWTFELPHIPEQGQPRPAQFVAYLVVFLIHFGVLLAFVAGRLWRAGAGQPSVARRRMRMLAAASALLTLALVLAAVSSRPGSAAAVASGILGTLSAVGFWLGLAPPRLVRMAWRRPEQERVQAAIGSLMALATNQEEVAARVLEPLALIVGARAVAVRNELGETVGAFGGPAEDWESLEVEMPGGSVSVWTSPYAPYFSDEELALVRTLGALTGLALDRVRLFEAEHEARLALERANEIMNEFVALAAHELRTPVTAIHGFVRTLNHLGDRLDEVQRAELAKALEQQTYRTAVLVEQLLDLSRLDAHVIEIAPQRFNVRRRVREIVEGAAVGRTAEVDIVVPDDLVAAADPTAFERIVGNLVTNAFRYGLPPVTVSAERTDHHFRLAVEDRGAGVDPIFVPNMFERFSRSDAARSRTVGTGLGLAIARSYARAHNGELLYTDASPHGARFVLVLPA
jgi:signal transduction histidine kinase